MTPGLSRVRRSGIDPRAAGRLERKASLPDEFPDRRLPAIDAGPDHDPFEPPELPDELIDELLAGARTPEELAGPEGRESTRLNSSPVKRSYGVICLKKKKPTA